MIMLLSYIYIYYHSIIQRAFFLSNAYSYFPLMLSTCTHMHTHAHIDASKHSNMQVYIHNMHTHRAHSIAAHVETSSSTQTPLRVTECFVSQNAQWAHI